MKFLRKAVGVLLLSVIIVCAFVIVFNVDLVKAEPETIYIKTDGVIDPPTAPIQRDGDVYTFTDNIYDLIVIERNNTIIDGNGFALNGSGSGYGFSLSGITNVTVKNIHIKGFYYAVYLGSASYISLFNLNITDNEQGILLSYSSNNIITENNIEANPRRHGYEQAGYGINLDKSSNNTVYGNNITNNGNGIFLTYSSNNTIFQNNITANGYNGIKFASSSNNSIVRNNIENNSNNGIFLSGSLTNNIAKNNITKNGWGIYFLAFSNYNNISENEITANSRGIYFNKCSNNTIQSNNIKNNVDGIQIAYVSEHNSILRNNITANSGKGLHIDSSPNNNVSKNTFVNDGIYSYDSYENIVTDNTVNDRPLVYLEGLSDYLVENAGQVILINCNNIRVGNLNLSYTEIGVELWKTNSTEIIGNNMTDSWTGVYLHCSLNNSIIRNNIVHNEWGVRFHSSSQNNNISRNNIQNNNNGISLYQSSNNNIFSGNNITSNNGYGISFSESSNNILYHNNLIDNAKQVKTYNLLNVWNDDYPFGGNYWSNYTSIDLCSGTYQDEAGSDGIGDTPHIINANNQDNYPLIKPYGGSHDIGIASFTPQKTVIGQDYSTSINVKIINYGLSTETFNVTLYANTTIIATFTDVSLTSRNSTSLTCSWDTASFSYGEYTLKTVITPVLEETDLTDNSLNCTVKLTIPGDITGDFYVDISDATQIGLYWLQLSPPAPANVDINGDGIIDIGDATLVGLNWLQHA